MGKARWAAELIREEDANGSDYSVRLGVAALGHLMAEGADVEAARFARVVLEELMPQEDDVDTVAEVLDTESDTEGGDG